MMEGRHDVELLKIFVKRIPNKSIKFPSNHNNLVKVHLTKQN